MPSPAIDPYPPDIPDDADLSVSVHISLFPSVQRARADNLFLHQRASMLTMSHEIENRLANSATPGVVFSGFQSISKFTPQIDRYHKLAALGHQVFVFGIPDQPPPTTPGITFVEISERHALAREWFVIASTGSYFSALVAEELLEFTPPADPGRQKPGFFQGIWSFDEQLVSDLVRMLRESLGLDPAALPSITSRDYEQQLSAIAISANRLISRLEQRNHDLSVQQQEYEDLVNMLVHDLRGSLTSVIGSLELIASNRYNTQVELHDLVTNALMNSRRLSHMISDVLDVSKMEAGRLALNRQMVDVAALLRSVYDRWLVAALWEKKQLDLSVTTDLPMIIADAEKIERVLDNLVSNGLKYGERVKISAGYRDGFISVYVSDDGPGIPAGQAAEIFEKFTPAHAQEIQRKGTGLGLTFTKMTVEAHGGRVAVGSSQDGGALFTIQLPVVPTRQEREPDTH